MLTELDYVKQQQALGRRIHEHDGVFWEEVYPFYCKPAFIYKAFEPGTARPARLRSLLGYSHQVDRTENGNRALPIMVLERNRLDNFGIMSLPSKRRTKVRRGLENCVIRAIEDLEPVLEQMREINISQSLRQAKQAGAEAPVSRYLQEADDWRSQIRREFQQKNRTWIGAFVNGLLIAYIRSYTVEGICVGQHTKAHDDAFQAKAVDALFFEWISSAAADSRCQCIISGSPLHGSLNDFKENFLFELKYLPYYSSSVWLVNTAKRLLMRGARTP